LEFWSFSIVGFQDYAKQLSANGYLADTADQEGFFGSPLFLKRVAALPTGRLNRKFANAPLSHAPLARLPQQVCGLIPPARQRRPTVLSSHSFFVRRRQVKKGGVITLIKTVTFRDVFAG